MRERYILNPTLMGIEEADAVLLVGVNPRKEAPVWNARIRKAWLWNELTVGIIGQSVDLTYDYEHLGTGPDTFDGLYGRDSEVAEALRNAERPMVVVGEQALCREDGVAVLKAAHDYALGIGAITDNWAGFGVLHSAAGRVGALDVGFLPGEGGASTAEIMAGEMETVLLLGADEAYVSGLTNSKVVYIGHHGDAGAAEADIILPCAAYTEMTATYENTEGRVQMTRQAVQPKGEAKEGWAIFRALSAKLGKTLGYDSADALRSALRSDGDETTIFAGLGYAPGAAGAAALRQSMNDAGAVGGASFTEPATDFYLTNPIARASKTMAECSMLKRQLEHPVAAE